MRDTITVAGWVGGALLISVSLMVLCQHAEGERTRAELKAARAHVDNRIQSLDRRLTDMQADVNRRKLASAANPPLDPRRLVTASKELDQLIGTPPPPAAPAPPAVAKPTVAAGAATDMVRVCPGGHFYHRVSCKRVQKAAQMIVRASAESQGWKRCPTCLP